MFLDICLTLAMTLQGQATFKDDIGVIGIRRNVLSDVITRVHPDTPAQAAGLLVGDKILWVEGGEIDGQPGTVVTIRVKRGKEIIVFKIERQAVSELPQLNRSNYTKNR